MASYKPPPMQPFIYINGYPGVGKLTVAKELRKLLPGAKVIGNHLLIDPVAAVYERSAEEYQPLQRALRRQILDSIAASRSTRDVTWIFTDQQSSSELGSSTAKEYQDAAARRGSLFISVILRCGLGENMKRANSAGRSAGNNTKLKDLMVLRTIREREDIFRFNDEYELELDVTGLAPTEAAVKISEHVGRVLEGHFSVGK